jgi:hypothetical protein
VNAAVRRKGTVHVLQVNPRAGERLAQCEQEEWQRSMERAASLVVTEHVITRARRLGMSDVERDADLRLLLDALGLLDTDDDNEGE